MPTMSTKPGLEVGLEEEENCSFPCWRTLPDHFLLHIFSYLDASSLAKTGLVCKGWLRVAFDELLWKDLFYRHWGISRKITMAPGKYSWIQEYKRLLYHTPSVESEVLKQHADQVLHVSFSHNGKMFATCSKDGFIRVWDATYPTSIKYKADMRKFTWKYTQFSQFNSTDTLLLVSGVHFGSLSTSGEIAVFSLEGEFVMQSRVMNKPYDVFGTWYNDFYLLSGNLHWTGHLNSCSAIWLNKAYQETSSEEESVVMRLFKFSNINASSIRTIMIANCLNSETGIGSAEVKTNTDDASSADSASVSTLPLIGDFFTNQDEEDMNEEQEEPYSVNEGKEETEPKKSGKVTKSLQSIQVFENGEFITKFLEVDAEEPNNRLNGTIEYSSDYRLAEEPEVLCKKGLNGDTSGSELSTNGNHSGSEISSVNGSSDVIDQSHSSLEMDIGNKYNRCDSEDSRSENILLVKSGSRQNSPFDSELVQFGSSSSQSLENSGSRNSFSTSDSQCTNNYSQPCLFDSTPVHFDLDTAPLASEEKSDMLDLNGRSSLASVDSQSAGSDSKTDTNISDQFSGSEGSRENYSPKRNHGQTSAPRDPTGNDLDFHVLAGTSAGSSDSLELPEKTPRLTFCCVDYKKQKRVLPEGHSVSGNVLSGQEKSFNACLGRQRMDINETQSVSDNILSHNRDLSSRTLQSRICLGRQSVETIESQSGLETDENKSQTGMCINVENQSASDVGIDCVPGHVNSKMCARAGTHSVENMDCQSSDNEVKVKCKPVRNTCAMQSDTQSVTLSACSSQANIRSSDASIPKIRYKGKSKRSRRTSSKKVRDKYLIFTKGSETYTPHQIGIKRIKPFQAFNEDGSRLLPNVSINTHNTERSEDSYDDVDHLIDMHGHIIGMTLSPDQRYLYVNSRPWPKNYFIENPLYPPPIAQEIDIHVIDLLNMREVGTMHRAHKAYTSNDECFFIFLDVCEEYVASGAEDKHGYLWDRHYGLCLHKYPHTDVVNSVAFNPADPEVLVTVSDDFSIKIWRSLSREKEVVKAFNKEHSIRVKHVQALMSETSEFDEKVCSGEGH